MSSNLINIIKQDLKCVSDCDYGFHFIVVSEEVQDKLIPDIFTLNQDIGDIPLRYVDSTTVVYDYKYDCDKEFGIEFFSAFEKSYNTHFYIFVNFQLILKSDYEYSNLDWIRDMLIRKYKNIIFMVISEAYYNLIKYSSHFMDYRKLVTGEGFE